MRGVEPGNKAGVYELILNITPQMDALMANFVLNVIVSNPLVSTLSTGLNL